MVTDSYHPTVDGVVVSVDATKRMLESAGHEVFVAAPDPGKDRRRDGVIYFPARRFKGYEGYFLPIFPSNKIEIVERINPDVIHVHGVALMAIKGMLAARELKRPLIITFHTMVGDTMKYYSPIKLPEGIAERLVWVYLRNLLKRADAVISPTASIAMELKENGVVLRNSAVIPTGVDLGRFTPETEGTEIKRKYSLEGKKVVIHVGRMSYEKNISTIVKALECLDEDVMLMIVGKGPAEEELRRLVADMGLEKRVIFTGFVDDADLPHYYAAADAAVSASEFETQGLSVIEALSTGLPVACIRARAFSDFMKDGYNGYFFDGTPSGCANAISACLSAGPNIRENARETAGSFSADSIVKELTDLYKRMMIYKKERMEKK